MPDLEVIFHPLASQEFERGMAWYRERSSQAAENLREAVGAAVAALATRFEALPITMDSYRWVRVKKFPYVLIAGSIAPRRLMVVAFAHTSRRPNYWKRRKLNE